MIRTVLASSTLAVAALVAPMPADAHPHIFVDTGVELIHGPEGQLVALRITWVYDELFSLLLLEDMGLDSDYDGVLTPEEVEQIQGFDMDWPDWFEGDVYVSADGRPVALGPPQTGPARLLDNGMLEGVHVRPLVQPVDVRAEPVVVKVYDPTFYTAYSIVVREVSTDAPNCIAEVFAPDLDTAYAQLESALQELMGQDLGFDEEVDFPAVGDRFAEEVRLSCTDGS